MCGVTWDAVHEQSRLLKLRRKPALKCMRERETATETETETERRRERHRQRQRQPQRRRRRQRYMRIVDLRLLSRDGQVVSTCDYATDSWLWGFLSVGLNCQVFRSLRQQCLHTCGVSPQSPVFHLIGIHPYIHRFRLIREQSLKKCEEMACRQNTPNGARIRFGAC